MNYKSKKEIDMKKFSFLTVTFICGTLFLSGPLLGSEEKQEESKESYYIKAGTGITRAEYAAYKEQIAEEEQAKDEENQNNTADSSQEEQNQTEQQSNLQEIKIAANEGESQDGEEKITHGVYYYTSHVGAIHYPFRVWEFREKIELQDGTIWSVAYSDRWKLVDWLTTDIVLILRNHSIFSIYDYVLVNQRTGDYVDVNLSEMEVLTFDPTFYGQRRWVISVDYIIDYLCYAVTLNDGSVWTVYSDDDSKVCNWYPGQVVVIGINDDSWSSGSNPNILIHFNSLKYARVNCIN